MSDHDKQGDGNRPNLAQVIGSVLAAAFGVQSEENRKRDFQHGNPATFAAVGAVATILFILLIYGIVRLVVG